MSNRAGERLPEEVDGRPEGAPSGPTQPTSTDGRRQTVREGSSPTMEPMSVHVTEMLQRLSNRVDTFSTELSQLRDHVDNGFRHFEGRVNRSRETENFLRGEQLRSERTREMPSMMPNDVKPAKIKSIATTNIDELRNWFRHARGYLRYHSVNPEEQRGVYWVSGFLEGPLSKWWYSQVAQTGDEVGGGFSGVSEMEKSLIQEFCGRTPAEQARLNLDKARQKTTVLKYANYFREQLLELPHRHEEDNVHDFQRGLRPSIHKEVALKNPKTLHEAIQAALRAEAAETKIETTQRSTGRLNAIEEDSDFSEAGEEIDSESEEDSHGATEEKPRELYEIRRLTQEEVDRFKKEGKCFICHKKGHIAIDCPDRKNKKNDRTRKSRPGK